MPLDYRDYPPEWPQFRRQILERDGQRCNFCGLRNGLTGYRDHAGKFHRVRKAEPRDIVRRSGGSYKVMRIVLTIAHLGVPYPDGRPGDKDDRLDARPENLAALCQYCHLNYDRREHVRRAAETRRARCTNRTHRRSA